jgi:hypothetical protein
MIAGVNGCARRSMTSDSMKDRENHQQVRYNLSLYVTLPSLLLHGTIIFDSNWDSVFLE